MAGFVGGKEVAITGARIGMNRLQKLVRAAAATVIILTVGAVTAAEIEFKINPNKLPPCPKPDMSKKFDVGVAGRTGKWRSCWGRYESTLDAGYKGDVLEGEWLNGKQHGQGAYTSADGDRYVGYF
jgi:hypothetical protein